MLWPFRGVWGRRALYGRLFVLLCAVYISSSVMSTSQIEAADGPSRCQRWLKSLGRVALLSGFVLFGTTKYHDVKAAKLGREHIGGAVYFDWKAVESVTDANIRDLIRKEHRSSQEDEQIIRYYTDLLSGDYDESAEMPQWFPSAIAAEHYLKTSGSHQRGVCRHKAAVLAEILKRLGFNVRLEGYIGFDNSWHLWVHVRGGSWVADPTAESDRRVMDRSQYLLWFPPARSLGCIVHPGFAFKFFGGALR